MNNKIRMAAIMTCYNRAKKTINCLQSLAFSIKSYNSQSLKKIHLELFLTDDGCSDNTVQEVKTQIAPLFPVHIISGSGNLFWAGGMRVSWNEALASQDNWDYYLLINDDVVMFDNCLKELFNTEDYCISKYGKPGLYSGITTAPGNPSLVTYGGDVWDNRFLGSSHRLPMSDEPQLCDITNANILLVPSCVVEKIGIFYDGYIHGAADYDYAVMASRNDIPVFITANSCGECEFDHTADEDKPKKLAQMTLADRKKYFAHPLHSMMDHLTYTRRVHPFRYPFVLFGRFLNLYFPKLYVCLYNLRIK